MIDAWGKVGNRAVTGGAEAGAAGGGRSNSRPGGGLERSTTGLSEKGGRKGGGGGGGLGGGGGGGGRGGGREGGVKDADVRVVSPFSFLRWFGSVVPFLEKFRG